MKPILLLADERWRVELRRITPADDAVADPAAYSAVIVINDGGAATVQRLLSACELRGNDEDLGIGVLTFLDKEDRQFSLTQFEPRLRLEVKEETVQAEYQV